MLVLDLNPEQTTEMLCEQPTPPWILLPHTLCVTCLNFWRWLRFNVIYKHSWLLFKKAVAIMPSSGRSRQCAGYITDQRLRMARLEREI